MRILLTFLGGCLFLYHAVNYYHHDDFRADYQSTELSFRICDRIVFRVPTLISNSNHESVTDGASLKLVQVSQAVVAFFGERHYFQTAVLPLNSDPKNSGERSYAEARAEIGDPFFSSVRDFIRVLRKKQIDLLLLPIPEPGLARYQPFSGIYNDLLGIDRQSVVNLAGAYRRVGARGVEGTLFESDSHWSPLGIAIAAKEVVGSLRKLGWKLGKPTIELARVPTTNAFEPVRYLPTPFVSQGGKEGDRPRRLVLLGTSFTRKRTPPAADFATTLSALLQLEVQNFSFSGAGLNGSLNKMRQAGFVLRAGDLVVWEFPIVLFFVSNDARETDRALRAPFIN